MTSSRLALLLSVLLAACGSEGPSGSGGSGGGAGGSGGGSGASGGSGGGGDQTVTLTMGPFTVNPGQEVYKCQFFKNPFGADVDIKTFENHMAPGSHHMFLFLSSQNQDGPLVDCQNGGFEFHPYVFTTQSRDSSVTYPDTVGMQIPGNQGLEIDAHYINTTQQPLQAMVTTIMHVAQPGTVTQHAGEIFFNNIGIVVGPQTSPQTISATCPVNSNINLLFAGSHMHKRADHFVASTDTRQIFEAFDWADPPPAIFNPPMAIEANTPITWSCEYVNDTGQTLTFGESAENNVMCIFSAQYYPVPAGQDPLMQCMRF